MQIYIMRHGNAKAEAATDKARKLSLKGKQEVADMVAKCEEPLCAIEHAIVSPYTRTRETFNVIQSTLACLDGISVSIEDAVTPGSSVGDVFTRLTELKDQGVNTVLLVSHQPLVGTLVDSFCDLEPGCYRMGTASLASISADTMAVGCGELNWLKQHP